MGEFENGREPSAGQVLTHQHSFNEDSTKHKGMAKGDKRQKRGMGERLLASPGFVKESS